MPVVVALLWSVVLARSPGLRRATAAYRAQWYTFFVLALALSVGLETAGIDRALGTANLALVVVHLGAVIAAACELEFVATARALGSTDTRSRWRPRHTFTATVCALIIVCRLLDPGRVEASSAAASYAGSLPVTAGRLLMLAHLGTVAFIMLRLCRANRAVSSAPVLRTSLAIMLCGCAFAVAYSVVQAAMTLALAARVALGGYATSHFALIDQVLISVSALTFIAGSLIPLAHNKAVGGGRRRAIGRITPVWAALLHGEPDRTLADHFAASPGADLPFDRRRSARAHLLRLVLECEEARERLLARLAPALAARARAALSVPDADAVHAPSLEAVLLRLALALPEQAIQEPPSEVRARLREDLDAAARRWTRIAAVWDSAAVRAALDALAVGLAAVDPAPAGP